MRRRLLLFFLPSIYVPVSTANESLWNCSQDKNNKEWVCVGEKKSSENNGAEKTPARVEPVKETQPAPEEVVEKVQPAIVEPQREPVENVEAQPLPAEKSLEPEAPKLPVNAKTDQDARQVSVEPTPIAQPSNDKKLLQTENNRPGWTCDAKSSDKKWDCKLVGADPKGQPQIIETSGPGISLLTPAFDHNEELTFNNLKSQLKYDPWQSCMAPGSKKPRVASGGKDLRDEAPLDIDSNYAEIYENEIYSYTGNVEMNHADQHSVSNKATYDTVSETLDLQGSVYYNEDELALHSESASLNLASNQARLRDALFISPATPLRGRAKTIYRESSSLSRYKDVAYTSCRPGNQDWVVHASELKINKISGQGSAKNAWLEFKGTPVLYSPYLSFPTDNRRLSGFLAPSFGNTQRTGFSFSLPYYWNIAPNYDLTLRPRYLSKRGPILGGDFRYLTEMTKGSADLEFMPYDQFRDTSRYSLALKNISQFTPHIYSNFDLNKVSDKDYLADLGNALSMSTYSSFLLSQANLGYANEGVSLRGHVDSYQSIDKAILDTGMPYRRLPQVNLNLNHAFNFMPLNTAMDAEYTYFQHDALVNGQRTNVKPSVSFPLQTASAFLTPKISLLSTQYSLSNPKEGAASLATDSVTRTLPIFSTDTGLYMEKDVDFANRSYLHTLEPRLFYLYIPRKDQSNIPIFDTSFYDVSFNSLFLENRFSGLDRVGDANQLTAALTTRLVDAKSGRDKLKLSVGQIAYFQDRKVTLPGYQEPIPGYFPDTDKFSNLVSELNVGFTDHVSLSSGAQWNPSLNRVVRHNATLHYINGPGEIINFGYRYRKNTMIPDTSGKRLYDIIQSDVSAHWPVYNDWSVVGRWTYSLLNNSTQESFLGLEKENCCWRFRIIGRRWINSLTFIQSPIIQNTLAIDPTATGVSQVGVFFQIELKGLTGIGEKLDQFFERQIYGYRAPKDD
ncbi:LPS assembly protein LptD [Candidatus Methylobacter oryzae]|uniref:LPS-assembly protein LptD n=1 Tax=Candidatus Methylobacter oryzae TaxID=2497749 RepID=A0ABY3C5D7_9GAMM|nr:LPS assembly protein LptD [Candidatus Methylobacter oryzae]TRW89769.1 LPS assembly protein LptD [Candidatus Methylobacter oryzae]